MSVLLYSVVSTCIYVYIHILLMLYSNIHISFSQLLIIIVLFVLVIISLRYILLYGFCIVMSLYSMCLQSFTESIFVFNYNIIMHFKQLSIISMFIEDGLMNVSILNVIVLYPTRSCPEVK